MSSNRSEYYKRYIRSDEWKQKEQERMNIDGNCCVMCGRPSEKTRHGLQVHHITYRNLGHEEVLTDLVTLCAPYHKKMHNYLSRIRSIEDERYACDNGNNTDGKESIK